MKKALVLSYFALVAVVLFTPQLGRSEAQERIVLRNVDLDIDPEVRLNLRLAGLDGFDHRIRIRDRERLQRWRRLDRLDRLHDLRELRGIRRLDRLEQRNSERWERMNRLHRDRLDRQERRQFDRWERSDRRNAERMNRWRLHRNEI